MWSNPDSLVPLSTSMTKRPWPFWQKELFDLFILAFCPLENKCEPSNIWAKVVFCRWMPSAWWGCSARGSWRCTTSSSPASWSPSPRATTFAKWRQSSNFLSLFLFLSSRSGRQPPSWSFFGGGLTSLIKLVTLIRALQLEHSWSVIRHMKLDPTPSSNLKLLFTLSTINFHFNCPLKTDVN